MRVVNNIGRCPPVGSYMWPGVHGCGQVVRWSGGASRLPMKFFDTCALLDGN